MLIDRLFSDTEVVLLREHPRQARSLQRAAALGRLHTPLPGVYLRTAQPSPLLLLVALCAWRRDTVAIGRTALQLHLARPLTVPLQAACPGNPGARPGWVRLVRTTVPAHLVLRRAGVRLAARAFACVELAATDGGEAIFDALRERAVTPHQLDEALRELGHSRGQRRRREVLEQAIDNPWSVAEARLHRVLRRAGITGWVANPRLVVRGVLVVPDVLFEAERVVLEFDGEAVHSDHAQFERDRRRQNLLVLAGYRVLRITWQGLVSEPGELVQTIREVLRSSAAG